MEKVALVVTTGGVGGYKRIIRGQGYKIVPMGFHTFDRQIQACAGRLKQSVSLALIHGVSTFRLLDDRQRPIELSDADLIARRLKVECIGILVIVMSNVVSEPIYEVGRPYDALIPHSRSELQRMVSLLQETGTNYEDLKGEADGNTQGESGDTRRSNDPAGG